MTLHEHKGRGTPKRDAFITGQSPLPPRCFSTSCFDTRTLSNPAIKKPNNRYGDISRTVFQKPIATDLTKLVISKLQLGPVN
jgi:hypothetical protein